MESSDALPANDHRVIGQRMGLFTISQEVGPGLVLWLPAGGIVRSELQSFMQNELKIRGYLPVFTPHIGKIGLYKTSGHYPYYADSQYPPIEIIDEEKSSPCACSNCGRREEAIEDRYILKPMNCPHHCMIFKAMPRSYRDLPLRLAEFGTVYRYEAPGSLLGLMRVRGLTQDDAHIFCTPDQVASEIRETIRLTKHVLQTLGLSDWKAQLSLRGLDASKYGGDAAMWNTAEAQLREIVKDFGLPCEEKLGEAAFYGPKIDFQVTDAGGRERQLGTVQLDYSLPERFGLEYIGNDGKPHRPVMIHRAPFGSFERLVGILIEHYEGHFPTWLAPVQVRIANITESSQGAARVMASILREHGFRVDEDIAAAGNIRGKVKDFETSGIPWLAVIGDREAASQTVALRQRGGKNHGSLTIEEFIRMLRVEIRDRKGQDELS